MLAHSPSKGNFPALHFDDKRHRSRIRIRIRAAKHQLHRSAVTPLEVSGTVSATHFIGDGSGLTGIAGAGGDRIVDGSVNAVAEQTSGTVRVSGTLALNNPGNEPCDAAHAWSLRINQATGYLQKCRPLCQARPWTRHPSSCRHRHRLLADISCAFRIRVRAFP
jgi:hypothetical protein